MPCVVPNAMNAMGRATGRHGSRLDRGFTMVEVIAALAALGVLAAAAVPVFSMVFGPVSNQSVAEQLVKILARARQLAITRNVDVCVTVADNTVNYRMGG